MSYPFLAISVSIDRRRAYQQNSFFSFAFFCSTFYFFYVYLSCGVCSCIYFVWYHLSRCICLYSICSAFRTKLTRDSNAKNKTKRFFSNRCEIIIHKSTSRGNYIQQYHSQRNHFKRFLYEEVWKTARKMSTERQGTSFSCIRFFRLTLAWLRQLICSTSLFDGTFHHAE